METLCPGVTQMESACWVSVICPLEAITRDTGEFREAVRCETEGPTIRRPGPARSVLQVAFTPYQSTKHIQGKRKRPHAILSHL